MRKGVRTVVLVWAALASAIVSAFFLSSLALEPLLKGVYVTLAVLMEGLKIWSWSNVGRGKRLYFAIAVPATLLTLLAALGFSTSIVDQRERTSSASAQAQRIANETRTLKLQELTALQKSLSDLDPGYVTAKLRISSKIDERLRDLESATMNTSLENVDSLGALGRRFGLDGGTILETFLALVALVIEAAIIALTLDSALPGGDGMYRLSDRKVREFLDQHTLEGGKVRGRRELVAQGVPERYAKAMLGTARERGFVTSQGRGTSVYRLK